MASRRVAGGGITPARESARSRPIQRLQPGVTPNRSEALSDQPRVTAASRHHAACSSCRPRGITPNEQQASMKSRGQGVKEKLRRFLAPPPGAPCY